MDVTVLTFASLIPLLAWVGLLVKRGGFWRADQQLPASGYLQSPAAGGEAWPSVIAVIPARNEAKTVGAAVSSLLAQDYPGAFGVVLVDDESDDGTAEKARKAAGDTVRLSVIRGTAPKPGWTGKLWAVNKGLQHAAKMAPHSAFVLLGGADIKHHPQSLRMLVAKAEGEGLDLVSLMVRLRCKSFWEHLLIPASVFFFQKLYPFPWVNDANLETAAAGGCMLVRRSALERAGGVEAIRGSLIDDCALAVQIKRKGPIWLGLTDSVHGLRAYKGLGEIWMMAARTAYDQLKHSPLLVIGAVAAMCVTYLGPPLAAVAGIAYADPVALIAGAAAWFLMAAAYEPTLYLYGQPAWRGLLLPLAAFLYTLMTVDSALRHWRGKGGQWKGRSYGETPE